MEGTIVNEMMHPWIVRVYVNMEKGLGRCGGSIVTSKYVITAKHCFGIDLKFTGWHAQTKLLL